MTIRSAVWVFALAGGSAIPLAAQSECSGVEPYVFVLLDSSGSMNRAPVCTSGDLALGHCSSLCPSGDCWLPEDSDHPGSKWLMAKQALYGALEATSGVNFGFATFNGDQLRVRAKHWSYRAQGAGPVLPGWGPFPARGDREVFGAAWACGTGAGNAGVGCSVSNPADLVDSWERERMLQWAKGGLPFTAVSTFWVRHAGVTYQMRYQPVSGTPPAASVAMSVRAERCLDAGCLSRVVVATQTVVYGEPTEFVSWSLGPQRTEPELDFFSNAAAGSAVVTNTCSGWEPNEDASADSWLGYSLRQPVASDFRGAELSLGDRVPLDWLDDHRVAIQQRLAPSLLLGEPTPDFRIARYLRDAPVGSEGFLRLRNEVARPLVAVGSTPLATSLRAFLTWYFGTNGSPGWRAIAESVDPLWSCRSVHLVLITDGENACDGDVCSEAGSLYFGLGVPVHLVYFGGDPPVGSQAACIAANGGTGAPVVVHHEADLEAALTELFASTKVP